MKKKISHSKMKLIDCYGECLSLENKLEMKLQELGLIATEIYGEELSADLCAGNEIEFRTRDANGFVDSSSTIRIEEVLNINNNY